LVANKAIGEGFAATARLLLLLDGFDELQGESTLQGTAEAQRSLEGESLLATICGGSSPWPFLSLRVVVTSRETPVTDRRDAVFGLGHRRLVLIPFTKDQVQSHCQFLSPRTTIRNTSFHCASKWKPRTFACFVGAALSHEYWI
jgi:hypothetical protein